MDKCPKCGSIGDNRCFGRTVFSCGSSSIPDERPTELCETRQELQQLQQLHDNLVEAARKVAEYYDNGDEEHSSQEMDLRIKKLSDTIAP